MGTLGRPHGLHGELYLTIASDDPRRFEPGTMVYLTDGRVLVVQRLRRHRTQRGERSVVAFEGVDDRTGAEALVGRDLVVPVEAARVLADGQWWDHDLIGCDVSSTSGERIGRVTDVLHPPANDVLVVAEADREHLVPLIGDVIREVDPGAKRIVIEPIPGLLDES